MGAIKRDVADDAFSLCVRERSNWICECCGKVFPEGQMAGRESGLHCSHFIGRRNKSTRYHPDNAFAHCNTCHRKFEENPHEFTAWVQNYLGVARYDQLLVVKNAIFRTTREIRSEIAKHYREEFARMRGERAAGFPHQYIEFVGFQ